MASERSNDEIFYDVFNYIDQLMHLVKPNKVLMLSIDGVAPRAKMNQQRCRRFKKTNIDPVQLEQLSKQGVDLKTLFNSDCISPGTEFMHDLHLAFDFFISKKISEDPLWTKVFRIDIDKGNLFRY